MSENKKFIPVAEPALVGNESKYVLDCVESTWISSNGKYLERFESEFAEFCGVKHAMACSNGTVALHLALRALDMGPGDEVIVPALTFVATANAVVYCGATPVFADVDPKTWNIDPAHVESLIGKHTKAIIPVHLFGLPADMERIAELASQHGIAVIEDAAEAHGARYRGKRAGSLGTLGTFSFYGNKILTTGEGGMVTTNDDTLAAQVRLLKGQGMDPDRRYWFPQLGYNYRMTNVAAAIGVAQLERAQWHVERRREIASRYRSLLSTDSRISFQLVPDECEHAYWMTSIVLENSNAGQRDQVMAALANENIETRPFFYPLHTLPMYWAVQESALPVSERLGEAGISLPSSATLTDGDQERVTESLLTALDTN